MNIKKVSAIVGCVIAFVGVLWLGVEWTVNRVYVEEGHSLMLRYKGPLPFEFWASADKAKAGHFAKPGEIGVQPDLLGPGRHFYCPLWWERTTVADIKIKTGEVAIVSSKLGNRPPTGEFLVDGVMGETTLKGVLRTVYPPGRYRVHPYAYQFEIVKTVVKDSGKQKKHSGWVEIPTGYVGVVKNEAANALTGATIGVQNATLPAGIYPINTKEQQVDIVEIGYRETTIAVKQLRLEDGQLDVDEAGEPQIANADAGINFPSNDGFPINMDFTAIWGVMPNQAADAVSTFGNVDEVENKVVIPQTESICRNHGSQYSAVELLVGEDRSKFQLDTSKAFGIIMEGEDANGNGELDEGEDLNENGKLDLGKNLTLLSSLVRHIYIPKGVREPIQFKYIADELTITRDQEQKTAVKEADLEEAKERVLLEGQRVENETDKLYEVALAEGRKQAGEIEAETDQLTAAIDKKTAVMDAEATVVRGEATANAKKLLEEAKSQKFELAVKAFGSPEAYVRWVFASELPDEVKLNLLYAGEGTFWTDLKGMSDTLLGKQTRDSMKKK